MSLFALCIGSTANAQKMQEIVATETIELRAEQARTFTLDQPVGRFSLSVEDIAQVIPETDRVFTIRGLKAGRVMMTAYAADGQVVHRANVIVDQTQGLVKIYRADVKDYIGFFCTSLSCGRADPDAKPLPYGAGPEAQQRSEGGSAEPARETR
ncbi:pilus assembly protein N-terminal domain-containing protein [Bradyrhizobium sp. GCM10027634]|uniref:pilus assembly protein N-terminal domain-containing protein n=1 Tax=unclassified Bradyrhizobium TaxID=2631580 RepID=UPI00263BC375|nr:pilus assembly protein N-terminal domain-containing protein [Bradyrhizobium sp. WYCCWR 12677]MDN5005297.1 pilus assembly protein N-terminal domain-containing protein [Bradyrhizobium sp. WYCCWR 12677]